MAEYRTALKLNPDYADAHYNLGLALAGCGQIEEAIAHFQKALKLKPDHATALNDLAWLRATCPNVAFRNGAAAVALAQRAIGLSGGKIAGGPRYAGGRVCRGGNVLQGQGTVREALDWPSSRTRQFW